MSTVQRQSSLSPVLVVAKQVTTQDFAGFQSTQTEIGFVNSTNEPITIPAGSTLYVTVRTSQTKDDGTRIARCDDVRVWTPRPKSEVASPATADSPF
jgi:hypothetical protein